MNILTCIIAYVVVDFYGYYMNYKGKKQEREKVKEWLKNASSDEQRLDIIYNHYDL